MRTDKHNEQWARIVAQQLLLRQQLLQGVLIGSIQAKQALEPTFRFQCPLQRFGCGYCLCQVSDCCSVGFIESGDGGEIVVPRKQLILPASMNRR